MTGSTMTLEKFNEIIADIKNQSNDNLEKVMDFLNWLMQKNTLIMVISLVFTTK
jgi:hypothetical protein